MIFSSKSGMVGGHIQDKDWWVVNNNEEGEVVTSISCWLAIHSQDRVRSGLIFFCICSFFFSA